jgi:hypothetical protein
VEVVFNKIKPVRDFPFPWTSESFFDAFPESVGLVSTPVEPVQADAPADLVVIAYQPWFLSPSIPMTSALKDSRVARVISGKPVITVIGARNMWLSAQEKMKLLIAQAGGTLVGNIALADRHHNLVSAVTIVHWMMGGKKSKYLGIFPEPGIAGREIANASRFGNIIMKYLNKGEYTGMQDELAGAGAVEIRPNLAFVEERGNRIFGIWAGIIQHRSNRKLWLRVFRYYLSTALFLVSPILITIYALLVRPFTPASVKRKIRYYSGISLNR